MATVKSTHQAHVLQTVRRVARKAFAGCWDTEEKVADTVSVAWEGLQAKPDAPASMLAYFAIRRVRIGRQFSQSVRSVDGPSTTGRYKARLAKPTRQSFELSMALTRVGDDPAEIAGFQIDYETWYGTLSLRQRAMLDLFVLGEKTNVVAAMFDCSAGRVSQMRRELMEDWQAWIG